MKKTNVLIEKYLGDYEYSTGNFVMYCNENVKLLSKV